MKLTKEYDKEDPMKYLKALTIAVFLSLSPLKAHANVLPNFPWPFQQIFLGFIGLCNWCDAKEKELGEWYYRAPSSTGPSVFEED